MSNEVETKENEAEATPVVEAPSVSDEVLGKEAEAETPETPEAEEAPEETKDEAPEFDPTQWSDERDEVADSVFQLLHEGGATPDEAKALLYDAIQSGKVEDIDKDALTEKVGKARANLIMAGVKNFIADREAATAAAVETVHKIAGGKRAWDAVAKWARETSPEGLAEYTAMIDAGGKQAELAVQSLVRLHNADPKTKSVGKTEIIGDGVSRKQEEGISQLEYGKRLDVLSRRGGATDGERADLLRLRRLGRQQGI
jgi:hypothetical protein